MDLEQATVHRLHKSSRLLLLLLLCGYLLLLLLPIELLVVRMFAGLERLLWFDDFGVAFVDDFIAAADLFLEEGVAIADGFFELAANDDDDVTTPPLLLSYEAELSPVKIRSNANSTLNELERNACDKSLSDTFMPMPVTKSRRVDSLFRKEELLESVIFIYSFRWTLFLRCLWDIYERSRLNSLHGVKDDDNIINIIVVIPSKVIVTLHSPD